MRAFAAVLAVVSSLFIQAALADPGVKVTPAKAALSPNMAAMMQKPPPRMIGPDKGDAVQINFAGPVNDATMAELVKTLHDSSTLGYKRAVIFISSGGGSVIAARFAVAAMKASPLTIETVVAADVGSAAVALYCAGEKRYFAPSGLLFLHQMQSYPEISLKTTEAAMRRNQIYRDWYDDLLMECAGTTSLPAEFDSSIQDKILDAEDAARFNLTNADFDLLRDIDYGALAFNILDKSSGLPFLPGLPN